MTINVVYPKSAHSAYRIAANIFADLARDVAGEEVIICRDDEELSEDKTSVVYIGSDAVNNRVAHLYLERKIDDLGFKYNTDAYRIFTKDIDGVSSLFLAGARPRAAIYAVYRYFELLGCRWFWDGDRINKTKLAFSGIDTLESPHFEYRGLRYFAHRSLHRFQAEHWNFDDWKQEIDWILKKRLNMFMLRIGLDDIFQKAFPDIVPYPELDDPYPETGINHHDRTPFWSLKYRGELRKKLLSYAFERDLIHPEDCGTVTHWYSRTPKAYLEKVNPKLLCGPKYNGELTAQTWDVLDDENLNNYFKLTDTHIKEYGRADVFHTIGLAERSFSADPEVNMRLKLYVYRRISSYLKENYPGAPLFIASWDIFAHKPDEARRLLSELDPKQAILFDYTSDSMTENNFTNWDVIGKFPWVFGIFGGYEPDNEFRGFYDHMNARLKLAKADKMCRGMILWPELSHGDTLATEYLAYNAWEEDTPSPEALVDKYCRDRYPEEEYGKMLEIWRAFLPILGMRSWNPFDSIDMNFSQNTFVWLEERAKFEDDEYLYYGRSPEDGRAHQDEAVCVLKALSKIECKDAMQTRDVFDISRTVISRYLDCAIRLSELCYLDKDKRAMKSAMKDARGLMVCLCDLLSLHDDYSLLKTLDGLKATTYVNKNFERTLKENAAGYYCRSYIAENVRELYLPELDIIFDEVSGAEEASAPINREAIKLRIAENTSRFKSTPLSDMQYVPKNGLSEILLEAGEIIERIDFSGN